MNTEETFYEKIREAESVAIRFEEDIMNFMESINEEDYENEVLYIDPEVLVDVVSELQYELSDFIEHELSHYIENDLEDVYEINKEAEDTLWKKLWERMDRTFFKIEEHFKLFSKDYHEDLELDVLESLWSLFSEAYYVIEEELECNFDLNFSESFEELEGMYRLGVN